MKVLIFSGGSGSASLQEGLVRNFPEINITLLINAYDNGKSTGEVRKHFNGQILGPSDVRKNQTRLNTLCGGSKGVSDFLEYRFDAANIDEAKNIIYRKVEEIKDRYFSKEFDKFNKITSTLLEYINSYFSIIKNCSFEDFSIGNIVYGYLAGTNGNSLQKAADIMKEHLELRHNVVLNSDESLYLQAITADGSIIYDEADIVDYNNISNKIVDIRFKDNNGEIKSHSFLSHRAIDEIRSADLIIFSTGTQWSSLIPTYKCYTEIGITFKEIIKNSAAKKYFLINGKEDKDMAGLNGDDILNVINNYFDTSDCKIVCGKNKMLPSKCDIILDDTIEKYNSNGLVKTIVRDYFHNPKLDDKFVFDWDDTIHGRNNTFKNESTFNKNFVYESNSIIVTGNSFHNVKLNNSVYADGGANLYRNEKVQCIDNSCLLTNEFYDIISEFVHKMGIGQSIIQNRGNVCISLKPITNEYRKIFKYSLENYLKNYSKYTDIQIDITGKTTIDIHNKNNNKLVALKHIKENCDSRIYYIGDELFNGNDKIVEENKDELNIITIPVKNPADTSIFIKAIS